MFAVCFIAVARCVAQAEVTSCCLKLQGVSGCLGVLTMASDRPSVLWIAMRITRFRHLSNMTWGVDHTERLWRLLRTEPVVVLIGFRGFVWYVSLLPDNIVLMCRDLVVI